ncbi:hypothetical protein SKAU_G00210010 [Synaphobranchus kaupii]|uniref:HECT domain-containing protein n=1 Tax=Synaphobranchus kaupii TaxID=118154 RepID=A0A9Q1IUG9_SYNKA|nr:hypothetical protein SKAU_G00210010 [Synaphobranchus kaupii]
MKERQQFNFGKKGGKKQEDKKVQINIGLMCLQNGSLKPLRGKTLSLALDPQTTADDLLALAVKKMTDFSKDLQEGPYILLYPDGSEIIYIPGTQKPFLLKDYKVEMGKPYARLSFFICSKKDFEEEQPTAAVSLEDVLMFATGLSSLPPAGIAPLPCIEFLTNSPYPMANTCANTLKLPLLHSYSLFKTHMDFGIQNYPGFGCF